jgi:hypothetical protein
MGAAGLEPAKPEGEGFTVPCNCHYAKPPKRKMLAVGVEPTTYRLQGGCSAIELCQLGRCLYYYIKEDIFGKMCFFKKILLLIFKINNKLINVDDIITKINFRDYESIKRQFF